MKQNPRKNVTEQQNPKTLRIDECSTLEMLELINEQDRLVPLAVQQELGHIAAAVDLAYEKLNSGGRMIYVGAGTSGRLGVLDASECPPTYGTPPEMVQGFIAGGDTALRDAVEGAEDDDAAGAALMDQQRITSHDIVVGITASGGAPFVLGAVQRARQLGAATVAVVNNTGTPLAGLCDVAIAPVVGPEVIAGSTRMKSGTAQKLVLNMLSTAVMVKLGKVYSNLMVDLRSSNKKLFQRSIDMVCLITGVQPDEAEAALDAAEYSVKTAAMMLLTGLDAKQAAQTLQQHSGRLKNAVAATQNK